MKRQFALPADASAVWQVELCHVGPDILIYHYLPLLGPDAGTVQLFAGNMADKLMSQHADDVRWLKGCWKKCSCQCLCTCIYFKTVNRCMRKLSAEQDLDALGNSVPVFNIWPFTGNATKALQPC